MALRKSICKRLQDGARQSIRPTYSSHSVSVRPLVIDSLQTFRAPLERSSRTSPRMQSGYVEAESDGALYRELGALRTQQSRNFPAVIDAGMIFAAPGSSMRIHVGRIAEAPPIEPTYGVGPVGGTDRDPQTKGSTPDDFRADDIHMAEPKEIAKEKAAIAQEEPPDLQVQKTMPQWGKPIQEEADSQRNPEDNVFEGETRKLEGTAQKEGDTTGLESDQEVEGQYGATPSDGKTTRA